MRKKMIAMLFVLILTLSGCADVSTAPKESDNYELVTETEAAAETESTESSSWVQKRTPPFRRTGHRYFAFGRAWGRGGGSGRG